ncbi:MAG: hypothetical protein ACR2LV_06135 [Solirubrobacteraceae bacterium]
MEAQQRQLDGEDALVAPPIRDDWSAVLAARRQPMRDRLELALAWNQLAAELRSGLARARRRAA